MCICIITTALVLLVLVLVVVVLLLLLLVLVLVLSVLLLLVVVAGGIESVMGLLTIAYGLSSGNLTVHGSSAETLIPKNVRDSRFM